MTIEQLIKQLVQTNAVFARHRGITVEVDSESTGRKPVQTDAVYDLLTDVLLHAIESSPQGSQVSISVVNTPHGVEVEIADSSEMTTDSVGSTSFVVAKIERDVNRIGAQFRMLNCAQGGIAYALTVPSTAMTAVA